MNKASHRLAPARFARGLVGLGLLGLLVFWGWSLTRQPTANRLYYVDKVYDGDTIHLSTGEKVRLIGIDCPESYDNRKLRRDLRRTGESRESMIRRGKAATAFTRALVEHKSVYLRYDVERYDRYGRTLAYVYLPDGTFVNAEILRHGHAVPMNIPPNTRYQRLFRRLYQEANEAAPL